MAWRPGRAAIDDPLCPSPERRVRGGAPSRGLCPAEKRHTYLFSVICFFSRVISSPQALI
eukprot:2982547-Pleurochrysis_carterae.AAC.1